MYRQRFLGSRKKTEQHFAAELCHGDPFEVRPPDICGGPAEVLQGAGPTVGPLAHGAMSPWCSMPKTKEKKGADPPAGPEKEAQELFPAPEDKSGVPQREEPPRENGGIPERGQGKGTGKDEGNGRPHRCWQDRRKLTESFGR